MCIVEPSIINALTGYIVQVIPEVILAVTACLLFLGATGKMNRRVSAVTALLGLGTASLALLFSTLTSIGLGAQLAILLAVFLFGMAARELRPLWLLTGVFGFAMTGLAFWYSTSGLTLTIEGRRDHIRDLIRAGGELLVKIEKERDLSVQKELGIRGKELNAQADKLADEGRAIVYSSALYHSRLSLFLKALAFLGGFILVLVSWDEVPDSHSGEYHGCLLLMVLGTGLCAAANDLVTLFLALELVSIPTYVLLYLPRSDPRSQEAAMKYFMLSIFSSALLLFGFSYLYGISGTTNIPALIEALNDARGSTAIRGVPLVALVLVVAGLGFRITAVPFHFYAPDVYQGTATACAAILAFIPKVAGFIVLVRILGFVPLEGARSVSDQLPILLWIMAAVTMSLGNVLAFLQDNVKRLLAYSSVAHAGYMLIGLAVAPKLERPPPEVPPMGGVEAVMFYLVAYGAMTIGAFAILSYLSTPDRPVETVEDLAGLGRSHPGAALLMMLFLFSLVGIPLTAGFIGKVNLFLGALSVPYDPKVPVQVEQARLFVILAGIGALNAAIAAYYYLRIVAVMFLRDALKPIIKVRTWPVLVATWLCACVTLAAGIYPRPLVQAIRTAVRGTSPEGPATVAIPMEDNLAADQIAPLGP
jgi:NADH-quinone oxidoreductase subunit N